jgi:PAS domain S-box-containing protein
VFLDRDMWEKIVLNLLSNAFKYTLEGEIRVAVVHRPGHVELSVSDTGTGIAGGDLPHIFERFRRVQNPRARTQEGTGIGLALVAELVKLHGGTIAAASEPGRGSTFRVSLPTGCAHLPADRIGTRRALASTALGATPFVEELDRWVLHDAELPGAAASAPAHVIGSPAARVLLADDNADMREYLGRLLGRYWTVDTTADGATALALARQRVPDLVLTDVMMPGLDGFELLRALRADPRTRAVPVILLSARAGEESRVEGLDAGADDYLVKPFSARELIARVATHLELARVRSDAASREREARAAAERAREQTGRILDSITDAFLAFDRDWRFTYINAAAAALLQEVGRTRDELIGRNIWAEFPDAVGTEFERQYRRAMAEQVQVDFEAYSRPLARWFGAHAYPSPDGLSVYLTDVTARKRAELALRRSQQELEDFFENAPIALHWVGPDGVMLRANQAELDLLGYRREEYVGRPIADFHVDPGVIEDILRRLAAGEAIRNRDARLSCKDGTIRHVLIDSNVLWGPGGEFLHTRSFTRDVTDLVRAEEERAQLLASERAARSEAEAANRSKDEFLAVLSHELRTPLNAMVGWTRMLLSGQLEGAASRRALEAIARSTEVQAQLIEDLLDVSRIVTGKLHVDMQPVRILPAVEAALESVGEPAARKGIRLESSLDAGGAMILGDETRVRQIVTNLLVNAIKFTPEGGRVAVRLERAPREAVITVSDSGVGISAEDLPRIFTRFHQATRSSRATSGLGLGLAIVAHLVRQHQGHLTAESDGAGRGARFTVRLPLLDDAPEQDAAPRGHAARAVDLRGVSILVVEDDPDGRDLVTEILRSRGATVRAAASAAGALAALAEFQPMVLVSDIGLPETDGYALIRQVRALAGGAAGVPAVALTAYARPEDRDKALAAGFQRHLTKPVVPDVLCAVVAELADGAAAL